MKYQFTLVHQKNYTYSLNKLHCALQCKTCNSSMYKCQHSSQILYKLAIHRIGEVLAGAAGGGGGRGEEKEGMPAVPQPGGTRGRRHAGRRTVLQPSRSLQYGEASRDAARVARIVYSS